MNNSKYTETLKRVAKLFNENNIDYAIAGGLVAELRSNDIKDHKDIDFCIKSKQLEQIRLVLEANGINLWSDIIEIADDKSWQDTVEHNVGAIDYKNGINIGFFVFEKQQDIYVDGIPTSDAGYMRKTIVKNNGTVITLRERLDEELEEYLFDPQNCYDVDGVNIVTQPLPYVMILKSKNIREHDVTDIKNMVESLSKEEIFEYNKYKKNISNTTNTAQLNNGVEGSIKDISKLFDTLRKNNIQLPGDRKPVIYNNITDIGYKECLSKYKEKYIDAK